MSVLMAGEVAIGAGIVAMATFVVVYWVTSRWERTQAGWHIMASTVAVLVLLVVAWFDWPIVVASRPHPIAHIVAFAAIAVTGVWRLGLMIAARTSRVRTHREDDDDGR